MRYLRVVLTLVLAAFLTVWAMAPAVYASNVSTAPGLPQMAFGDNGDDDEGQDADDDEDDEEGEDDDDNELVAVPVYWSPQYIPLTPQAAQQFLAQNTVRTPGLASPASIAQNGLLLVTNGPSGELVVPAPPYDRTMTWGSFGTYDNWARAFAASHNGNQPTLTDEIDFWASQAYAEQTGVSPYNQPLGTTFLQPPRPQNLINTPP